MPLGKLKPEAELEWRASAILEGLANFDPEFKKDDEKTPLGWLLGHLLDIRRIARAEIRAELDSIAREETDRMSVERDIRHLAEPMVRLQQLEQGAQRLDPLMAQLSTPEARGIVSNRTFARMKNEGVELGSEAAWKVLEQEVRKRVTEEGAE